MYTDLDLVLPIADEFPIFSCIFSFFSCPGDAPGEDWSGFFSDFPNTEETLNKVWIMVPSWAPTYICGRTLKAQRKDVACGNFSDGGCVWLWINLRESSGLAGVRHTHILICEMTISCKSQSHDKPFDAAHSELVCEAELFLKQDFVKRHAGTPSWSE